MTSPERELIVSITHTPGPWVIDGLFDADTGVDILAVEDPSRREDGVKICEVLPFDEDWTELEIHNAHLISAAPELLSALKGVFALIESGQLRRNTSDDANPSFAMRQIPFVMALKAAQVAIEKAEGGPAPRVDASTPSGEWVDCSRCSNPVHPGSACGSCGLVAPGESDMERDRR